MATILVVSLNCGRSWVYVSFNLHDSKFMDNLPAQVVRASSVNDFKNKLDAHWSNQEMVYNYRVEISGTESSKSIFQ